LDAFRLLQDLAIALAAALGFGLICRRLKQPPLLGYLVGGLLVGPSGIKLVSDAHSIEVLAEVGVVLLMFALGVETSFSELKPVRRFAVVGGAIQMIATVAIAWAAGSWWGLPAGTSILLGFIVAVSSTVVVLKVLMDRGALDAAHGRALLGLLIVQDLAVVLMVVLIPSLADPAKLNPGAIGLALGKAAVFLGTASWLGTRILPGAMKYVARTGSKELLLLAGVVLCFGLSAASYFLGLSLALGAFIAGLVISESDQSHQLLADIFPLRDLFSTVFFVSVGMLVDLSVLGKDLGAAVAFIVAIVAGKALLGVATARLFRYPLRTSLAIGLGLAQIGEFSFVMADIGRSHGLLDDRLLAIVLASAVATIILTPAMCKLAPALHAWWVRVWPGTGHAGGYPADGPRGTADLDQGDHVVICGFGRVGASLGEVLVRNGAKVLVIDIDQNTLQSLRDRGVPGFYGDAANLELLKRACLPLAKMLVIALPDPLSCRLAVMYGRQLNRDLPIIARAHRSQDVATLYDLGADEVVQPEFEASIEFIRFAMLRLGYGLMQTQSYTKQIRRERYQQLEDGFRPEEVPGIEDFLGEAEISWVSLDGHSDLPGHSLRDLDLRKRLGIAVLALKRDGRVIPNPDSDDAFKVGDAILVMGSREQLEQLARPDALDELQPT